MEIQEEIVDGVTGIKEGEHVTDVSVFDSFIDFLFFSKVFFFLNKDKSLSL